MIISRIKFKNWKNFTEGDISLGNRLFVVGSNASGKSNFLDIFRFLRDLSTESGGGLQKAIKDRGGLGKVRSLAARRFPNVYIEAEFSEHETADTTGSSPTTWRYVLEIGQEAFGRRRPIVKKEQVYRGDQLELDRPNPGDKNDPERLTQTHLEQVNSNQNFREIVDFLSKATYLHLVPQLLKYSESFQGNQLENDPFGQGFLERIAKTGDRKRQRRLKKIQTVLRKAVPQLQELEFERDESNGRPPSAGQIFTLARQWRLAARGSILGRHVAFDRAFLDSPGRPGPIVD